MLTIRRIIREELSRLEKERSRRKGKFNTPEEVEDYYLGQLGVCDDAILAIEDELEDPNLEDQAKLKRISAILFVYHSGMWSKSTRKKLRG